MIITAFPVGFFAGLFGIGGGLITVPFLFFIFEALGVNQNYLMHLAVGTSFSIIIPTSMVSVYTHNKHKSVDPNIVKTYGLFVIIGVLLGTTFAAVMKTKFLVIFFTIVVFFLGTYLLLNSNQQSISKKKFKIHFRILFGLISGFISLLFEILKLLVLISLVCTSFFIRFFLLTTFFLITFFVVFF